MNTGTAFQILQISLTTDEKIIKHAYAELSKTVHPEEHPQEWQDLFEAFQTAMGYATHKDSQYEYLLQPSQSKQSVRKTRESNSEAEESIVDDNLKQLFDGFSKKIGGITAEEEESELYAGIKQTLSKLREYYKTPYYKNIGSKWIYNIGRMHWHLKMIRELEKVDWDNLPESLKERIAESFIVEVDRYNTKTLKMKRMPKLIPPMWYKFLLKYKLKNFLEVLRKDLNGNWADEISDYLKIRYDVSSAGIKIRIGITSFILLIWSIGTFYYQVKYQVPDGTFRYQSYVDGLEEGSYTCFELKSIDRVEDQVGKKTKRIMIGGSYTNVDEYYFCRFIQCTTTDGQQLIALYKKQDLRYPTTLNASIPPEAEAFLNSFEEYLPKEDGTTNKIYGVMRKGDFGYLSPINYFSYLSEDVQKRYEEILRSLENSDSGAKDIDISDLGIFIALSEDNYFMIEANMPKEGDVVYKDVYGHIVKPKRIPFWVVIVLLELYYIMVLFGKNPILTIEDYTKY